jgi:hypothetical protein
VPNTGVSFLFFCFKRHTRVDLLDVLPDTSPLSSILLRQKNLHGKQQIYTMVKDLPRHSHAQHWQAIVDSRLLWLSVSSAKHIATEYHCRQRLCSKNSSCTRPVGALALASRIACHNRSEYTSSHELIFFHGICGVCSLGPSSPRTPDGSHVNCVVCKCMLNLCSTKCS